MSPLDKAEVGKLLLCSSILEDRVAEAYGVLSEKATNPVIKVLLKYISLDSKKHAAVFRGLAEILAERPIDEEECGEFFGKVGKQVIETAEKVKEIEIGDLPKMVENMVMLESFVGEEYLTMIHVKTLRLVAEMGQVNLDDLNMILDWVVQDEKRHETLIKIATKLVKK